MDKTDNRPFIVGICGGTCSGKSKIVKILIENLRQKVSNQKITVIPLSDFYKDELANKADVDYDHPTSIDWTELKRVLDNLLSNKTCQIFKYDTVYEKRTNDVYQLKPADIIIIEGVLSFYDDYIRSLYTIKIFLDTDEDTRLSRRVYKDVIKNRKATIDELLDKYLAQIKPDFNNYVIKFKKEADIIIPNYGGNFVTETDLDEENIDDFAVQTSSHIAIDMIVNKIKIFYQNKKEKNQGLFRLKSNPNIKQLEQKDL